VKNAPIIIFFKSMNHSGKPLLFK